MVRHKGKSILLPPDPETSSYTDRFLAKSSGRGLSGEWRGKLGLSSDDDRSCWLSAKVGL